MVSTPKPLSRVRPGPDKYKGGDNPVPVLAVGKTSPVASGDKWGGFVSKEKPSLVAPKQVKNQRFRSCWLCQKGDHVSYQCPTIPKDIQEKLNRQGLVFAKAVNCADRQAPTKTDKAQVHAVRVATLQSITEALTKKARTDFDLATETSKESLGSGKREDLLNLQQELASNLSALGVPPEQAQAISIAPKPVQAPPKLPNINKENVPPDLKKALDKLLQKYRHLWSGELGKTDATLHRIQLKPDAKPVHLQPYRARPHRRDEIEKQVNKLLKIDVIEPSDG
eukprot:contig_1425_g217